MEWANFLIGQLVHDAYAGIKCQLPTTDIWSNYPCRDLPLHHYALLACSFLEWAKNRSSAKFINKSSLQKEEH
jgi:hypothetical protein